ncbi:MAG: EF-hand domain-containing protein [Brevundimonas sp.]
MIMQGKFLGLTAVLGLALPLMSGCDASGENAERQHPSIVESAATADAMDQVQPPQYMTEPVEAPSEATPPPVRSAAPRREPDPEDPPEPATEVDPLIVIGPRDGETLGEYRARAERLFNRLDTDGDGRLDREEIISGVGQVRLRNALERADIDLDDHVSRQEFNDLVTRAFQRLDADGNGVITDTEFEAGDPLAVE